MRGQMKHPTARDAYQRWRKAHDRRHSDPVAARRWLGMDDCRPDEWAEYASGISDVPRDIGRPPIDDDAAVKKILELTANGRDQAEVINELARHCDGHSIAATKARWRKKTRAARGATVETPPN
jgi:hypothetical protein